jgi:hypothetical protein
MKAGWGKRLVVVLLAVVVGAGMLGLLARRSLHYKGPHTIEVPGATLSPALEQKVRQAAREAGLRKMSQAIELALRLARESATYGKGHTASLEFDVTPRQADPSELSHLTAMVLDVILDELRIDGRTWVALSKESRVLWTPVSLGTGTGHAWVYVQERRKSSPWIRFYVDPTLHQLVGSWTVLDNVQEPVDVPFE